MMARKKKKTDEELDLVNQEEKDQEEAPEEVLEAKKEKSKVSKPRQRLTSYQVTPEAKARPRRVQLASGSWVGIGGPVKIESAPPRISKTVREATPAEYAELATAGRFPHLVKPA